MVVPFGSARKRRSRTTYRPTVTPEGSTHVDTAFTGTTSSFSRTASGNLAVVVVVRQPVLRRPPLQPPQQDGEALPEIWERPPTAEQLANMWPGITEDACLYLPDLVDLAVTAGFRPLRVETATRNEWEEFESGFMAGSEEWLLANGDHPEVDKVRSQLDEHRANWLRGHRGVLGFAFLTLGVPNA
ncbi:hypothetical protein EDD99_7030 [Streptomyces sp. 846.5]|nr:hypothetical protein EDD99_7030 [Streptomyces sp. 846.5]